MLYNIIIVFQYVFTEVFVMQVCIIGSENDMYIASRSLSAEK